MDEEESHSECLICHEIIIKDAISLSDENLKSSNKELLERIINQILEQHSDGTILQYDTLCRTCFSSFKQVHEMEAKLNTQKMRLMNRFKPTNSIMTLNQDVESVTISSDEFNGPKKILDIPSSDDEEPEPAALIRTNDKLKTIEEIEEELVKIHGPPDDITIIDLQKANSENDDETDKLEEDFTEEEQMNEHEYIKLENADDDKSKILVRTINILKSGQDKEEKSKMQKALKDELTADKMVTREDNLYTCLLCEGDETVCGEAKPIMAHIKEAHDQRIYICDVCGDFFQKRTELSAHVDDHVANEEGDFQCETCNRIFNNLRLFRIHRRMHLPQNKSWSCDRCGKRCNSKNLLEEHMNTHTGFRPYQCAECGKDFASKYTFRAHEKTHVSRPRPYKCAVCPKTFLNAHNLTQHERTHEGLKDYTCHLCAKKFGSAHNLKVHTVVHTSYKPFICGLCGKSFARKAEIRDHERTHTGERPYKCEFCGANFSQRSNLQSHKRATHFDDKRYKCPDCGRAFKRRRLLDYHIKSAHTGERPFRCNVCEATFVYPEHFKKHRRIHTGEKPFRCEVCGKAFNSRDNRNAHRFVHSDRKPYECIECGAGFMRKPFLYQHMQNENHISETIIINQPRLRVSEQYSLVGAMVNGQFEITQRKVSRIQSDLEEMEEKQREADGETIVGDDMDEMEGSSESEKLFITEHMLVDDEENMVDGVETKDGEHLVIEQDDDDDGTIIIGGQRFRLKGEDDDEDEDDGEEEETLLTTADAFDGILTSEAIAGAQTQILQTKEGPVQLLAVRIPNDNGEEEEAWIKIIPENIAG